MLQADRRIVGTTVARAVRLEAAASNGQLLVDTATYNLLPADLKEFYGSVEVIRGKRDERFQAHRCTLVADCVPGNAALTIRRTWLWAAVAVAFLAAALLVVQSLHKTEKVPPHRPANGTNANELAVPGSNHDRERDAAKWAVEIGAEIKIVVKGKELDIYQADDLPKESFQLTHIDFRKAAKIADTDLERLSGTSVIDLNLQGSAITDAGVTAIAELRLLYLDLNQVGWITDIGAERIGRMGSLKWLYLNQTKVSDKGLTHLAQLTQLEELAVRGTQVTRAGSEMLRMVLSARNQRCIIEDDWSGSK
jgi:hypothetical protein